MYKKYSFEQYSPIWHYVLERLDVVKKQINNNHSDVQWNKLRPLPLPCCIAAGFSPEITNY